MRSYYKAALMGCLTTTLALGACSSSGGGSGSSGGAALFPLKAGTTTIKGAGQKVGYAVDPDDGVVVTAAQSGSITAKVTHNGDDITKVELTSGSDSKTWDADNSTSDTFGHLIVAKTNDPSDKHMLGFADPDAAENKFQYQTYGAWQDGNDTTGNVRVFSVGKETALADIPTSETSAKFVGTAGGVYADGVNDPLAMTAKAELDVNFKDKNATFKTTDTVLEAVGSYDALNMQANMTLQDGALSGTATTTGMSGEIDGRFYGPGAKEVGGTFVLTGGGKALGGGYGAVKQ